MLGLVTVTDAAPPRATPVVQVRLVELETFTDVQLVPPIFTLAPEMKFVPVIVTLVPPDPDPLVGEIDVIVGVGVELEDGLGDGLAEGLEDGSGDELEDGLGDGEGDGDAPEVVSSSTAPAKIQL